MASASRAARNLPYYTTIYEYICRTVRVMWVLHARLLTNCVLLPMRFANCYFSMYYMILYEACCGCVYASSLLLLIYTATVYRYIMCIIYA